MRKRRQYNQTSLFTPDQMADMVQILPDPWESFLQATKGATFNKQEIFIKPIGQKKDRKNKKLPGNGGTD